jgi:phage tail tube protein FII
MITEDIARQIEIDMGHDPMWTELMIRSIRLGLFEVVGRYESGKLIFRRTKKKLDEEEQ